MPLSQSGWDNAVVESVPVVVACHIAASCWSRGGCWVRGGRKARQRHFVKGPSFPFWKSRVESAVEVGAAETDVARMMDKPQCLVKPAVKCLPTSGSLSCSLGINEKEQSFQASSEMCQLTRKEFAGLSAAL